MPHKSSDSVPFSIPTTNVFRGVIIVALLHMAIQNGISGYDHLPLATVLQGIARGWLSGVVTSKDITQERKVFADCSKPLDRYACSQYSAGHWPQYHR